MLVVSVVNKKNISPQLSVKTKLVQTQVPLAKLIPIQKIIRLSQPELVVRVEKALSENPFLEKVEDSSPGESDLSSLSSNSTDISYKENIRESVLSNFSSGLGSKKTTDSVNQNSLETLNSSRGLSLTGDLLQQLDWLNFPIHDRKISEAIISLTDENGYVNSQAAKIVSKEMKVEEKEFMRIWLLLKKKFDPPGVVCEDIKDSLIIQLLRRGYEEKDLCVQIIRSHFREFSKKQFTVIAKSLGVPTRKVREAVRVINLLDPYPLRNVQQSNFDNTVILPDAIVNYRDGHLEVAINRETVPRIRLLKGLVNQTLGKKSSLDSRYRALDDSKKYWIGKKEEAENLVNAINYRDSNLKKVVDFLVVKQRDFFIEGFSKLKPYRMSDLSKELNLDKGTLSRLVNSKYISTEWGTFRLREMFSLPVILNNKKISPKSIQEKIKIIIEEFPEQKLTDQKIATMLKKLGYPIARRTVNKYRHQIN